MHSPYDTASIVQLGKRTGNQWKDDFCRRSCERSSLLKHSFCYWFQRCVLCWSVLLGSRCMFLWSNLTEILMDLFYCTFLCVLKVPVSVAGESTALASIVHANGPLENRKSKILRTSCGFFCAYSAVFWESNMAAPAWPTELSSSFLPCGGLAVNGIVGKRERHCCAGPFLCIVLGHSAPSDPWVQMQAGRF